MKIALIQLPHWHVRFPPPGLVSLASFINSKGHKTIIFDLNCCLYNEVKKSDKKLWSNEKAGLWQDSEFVNNFLYKYRSLLNTYINKIIKTKVRAVGFSVQFSSMFMSLEFAKLLKQKSKNIKIIMGGPMASRFSQGFELLQNENVDIVVMGEAENTLNDLLGRLNSNKPLGALKGILYKDRGRIIDGGECEEVNNLNSFPFLDFTLFPLEKYEERKVLPIYLSRGCINNCVFCNAKTLCRKYRVFKAARTFKEILHQTRAHKNVKEFIFCDSILNGNIKELTSLCDLLIEKDLGITWRGVCVSIRKEMTKDLLNKMYRAGCRSLVFGVESGSQKVLRDMKKRYDVKTASVVLKNTHDAGIFTSAGFIAGFPTETRKDFNETIKFLRANHKYMDNIAISEMCFTIDKGTYMCENSVKYSVPGRSHFIYWKNFDGSNDFPERLRRLKKFQGTVVALKGEGALYCYGKDKVQYKHLYEYYQHIKNDKKAEYYYKKYTA
jgi:radical SAM superfamily enzyme YgiQ (UPF0313 family)